MKEEVLPVERGQVPFRCDKRMPANKRDKGDTIKQMVRERVEYANAMKRNSPDKAKVDIVA